MESNQTPIEPSFKTSISVELDGFGTAQTKIEDYLKNVIQSDWQIKFSRSIQYTCTDLAGTENEINITDLKGNTWSQVVLVQVLDQISPTAEIREATYEFDLTKGELALHSADFLFGDPVDNCSSENITAHLNINTLTCQDLDLKSEGVQIPIEITLEDSSGNKNILETFANIIPIETKKVSLSALGKLYVGGNVRLRLGEELEYDVLTWHRDLILLEGEKGSSITVDQPGIYKVDLKLKNGCSVESASVEITYSKFSFPALVTDLVLDLDESGSLEVGPESVFSTWPLEDSDLSVLLSQTVFDCDDLGENQIKVQISDQSNNTWTQDFRFLISDKKAPILEVQDLNVNLDLSIGSYELIQDSLIKLVKDNCGISDISIIIPLILIARI